VPAASGIFSSGMLAGNAERRCKLRTVWPIGLVQTTGMCASTKRRRTMRFARL
jgi:hypothetical protein